MPAVRLAEVVPDSSDQEARPRLLLIAPPNSYRTVAYIESARRQGVDVLVVSEGEFSLVSEVAGGLHVDLSDPAAVDVLLAENRLRPFSGVVATDDSTVELGSRVAQSLGLPHNPPSAARLSRRKDLSRQALAGAGVPVPEFRIIDLAAPLEPQLEGFDLPAVVKPLDLSASRGVIRADSPAALLAACKRVQAILAGEPAANTRVHSRLLLESFVPGPEVAVEGLLQHGVLELLAIFDKPDPLDGPYFEESYYVTPSRHADVVQQEIVATVSAACEGLGLREGPVHAELRISPAGCVVLEVASRTIGGECARLLGLGSGYSLEELVIGLATGRPLKLAPPAGGAGVLMIPIPGAGILRRIEGISAARAVPYIEDILINIRDGYELVPLPEGSSYLGFMFAAAPTPAQAEAALRAAHAQLKIVIAPLLRLEDRR